MHKIKKDIVATQVAESKKKKEIKRKELKAKLRARLKEI